MQITTRRIEMQTTRRIEMQITTRRIVCVWPRLATVRDAIDTAGIYPPLVRHPDKGMPAASRGRKLSNKLERDTAGLRNGHTPRDRRKYDPRNQ